MRFALKNEARPELQNLLPELFGDWIENPASVGDFQLLELIVLADLLRVMGQGKVAARALRHVVKRAAQLARPSLWREAMLAADRLEVQIRAAPPLPRSGSDPIWNVPLGPRILLEAAQRLLRRNQARTARELVSKAQKAPAYTQLQRLPHRAWLREFEAELALHEQDNKKASELLNEAAQAWGEMEHIHRAVECRRRAEHLGKAGRPHVKGPSHLHLAASFEQILTQSPPALQISAEGSAGELAAHGAAEGDRLQLTRLDLGLPSLLSKEGYGSLSWLHHQLRVQRAEFLGILGNILSQVTPHVDGAHQKFLRLYSVHPLVMATPWESAPLPGDKSPHSRLIVRRTQPHWPATRMIQWIQQALNGLAGRGQHALPVDGHFSRQMEGALSEFWSERPIPSNSGELLRVLSQALAEGSPQRNVALLGASTENKQLELVTSELRSAYRSFTVNALPFGQIGNLGGEFAGGLIHIWGTFEEPSDSAEPILVLGNVKCPVGSLARRLGNEARLTRKPVVILEALLTDANADAGSTLHEMERQLLRRNLFAHRLYGSGSVLAVIATATSLSAHQPMLIRARALARLIAQGGSLREGIGLLHEYEGPQSPFGGHASALWAPHPDLPLCSFGSLAPA